MSLADVVANSGLHVWAEGALVVVIAAFVAVLAATLRRSNRATFERARLLPLDDGPRALSSHDGRTPAAGVPARD